MSKRSRRRQENKRIAFEQYRKKHHLDGCYFFCSRGSYKKDELIITKTPYLADEMRRTSGYHEILHPATLVKFVKKGLAGICDIKIVERGLWEKSMTLEELQTINLIEKLAGLT